MNRSEMIRLLAVVRAQEDRAALEREQRAPPVPVMVKLPGPDPRLARIVRLARSALKGDTAAANVLLEIVALCELPDAEIHFSGMTG